MSRLEHERTSPTPRTLVLMWHKNRIATGILYRIYDFILRRSNRCALIPIAGGPAAKEFCAELETTLRSMDTKFFRGGGDCPQFNVLDADYATAFHAIKHLSARYQLYSASDRRIRRWKLGAKSRGESPTVIWVTERVSDRAVAVSPVHLCRWKRYASYTKDEVFSPVSRHDNLSRVPLASMTRLLNSGADPCAGETDPFKPNFPIDVVYTWVNDQDPSWVARKAQYTSISVKGRATLSERFRNRDELKYSLRSLEMFAPWVNQIFIVTDDQTPSWLNVDHPKIKMVSHREIYRDPNILPTFNSSGIETQLHHISGLNEHFIYFNDDMFLGQVVVPADFFLGNGTPLFFASEQKAVAPHIDDYAEEYLLADRNALMLMKRDQWAMAGQIMTHAPYPCSRDYLYELEGRYQHEFDQCAANRFRAATDLRPIAFMLPNFGYLERKAVAGNITHRYLALWKPEVAQQMRNVLRRRRYKTFCINDAGLLEDRTASVGRAVKNFLEAYFPFKSAFEK